MPEPILIIDDAPVNRKLTQRVLAAAGYDARAVEDAETALRLVEQWQPRLVLTDLRLPGMDGLALARHIKTHPRTRSTVVIALTGCDSEDDRKRALAAGCDDYVLKPIDTRAFAGLIEAHLAKQAPAGEGRPSGALFNPGDMPAWAAHLRREFLWAGARETREAMARGAAAPDEGLKRSAYLWAGLAAALGYPELSVLARRLEDLLRQPDPQNEEWRPVLRSLSAVFSQTEVAGADSGPGPRLTDWLIQNLIGKRIAALGFEARDAARVSAVFERARATVLVGATGDWEGCDLVLAGAGGEATQKLLDGFPATPGKPLLLVGTRPGELQPEALLNSAAVDFAVAPWTDDELLARACRLLNRAERVESIPPPVPGRPAAVLIADDDPTTLTLLKTTLQNYGMECRVAEEGDQALAMIRSAPPDVAILDIIMPNLDGFEVLAAIRNDKALKNVRVMLLTALQQEPDLIRGFTLGADDYVLKPFSPVEIVARLKRLVRNEP